MMLIRLKIILILLCISLTVYAIEERIKPLCAKNLKYFSVAVDLIQPDWPQNRTYDEVVSLLTPAMKNEMINFVTDLPKDAKVLDVGFGEGVFLEQFKQKRPDIKTIGVSITVWEYPASKSIDEIGFVE